MTLPTMIVLGVACGVGAGSLAVLVILLKRVAYAWFAAVLDSTANDIL